MTTICKYPRQRHALHHVCGARVIWDEREAFPADLDFRRAIHNPGCSAKSQREHSRTELLVDALCHLLEFDVDADRHVLEQTLPWSRRLLIRRVQLPARNGAGCVL